MEVSIECPICDRNYESPVFLPCGHSVCKKHEPLNDDKLKCPTCKKEHLVPYDGFPRNLLAEAFLVKLEKIDHGSKHKEVVDSIQKLKTLLNELKQLEKHPEDEISAVVGELRNKIDLRREEEKKRIDDGALALVDEFDEYEKVCRAALDANKTDLLTNETKMLIMSLDKDLYTWEKELRTFERNFDKWKEIHEEAKSKYKLLAKEKEQVKQKIFSTKLGELELKQKKFCGEKTEHLM